MPKRPPKLIALDPDDYDARFVGRTEDGRQFFLTFPFTLKHEFLALYLFNTNGQLIEACIEELGPRSQVDQLGVEEVRREWLASLGEVTLCRIVIAPFHVERFGVEFGFIPQAPEEEGEDWRVAVEPGDYMAFHPPWRSGEYDT